MTLCVAGTQMNHGYMAEWFVDYSICCGLLKQSNRQDRVSCSLLMSGDHVS